MNTAPHLRSAAIALGALLGLCACSSSTTPDIRQNMVGMSTDELAACMGGDPSRTAKDGLVETWTYFASDGTDVTSVVSNLPGSNIPSVGDTGGRSCIVTAKVESGKVMSVDYQNLAPTSDNEQCALAIQRCGR